MTLRETSRFWLTLAMVSACRGGDPKPSLPSEAGPPSGARVLPRADVLLEEQSKDTSLQPVPPLPSIAPPSVRHRAEACEKGDGRSCVNHAHYMLSHDITPAPARIAAVSLERACTAGYEDGCAALADLHLRGLGVAEDVKRARSLLESSCSRGSLDACARLGAELVTAQRLAYDEARGRELLKSACAKGSVRACDALPSAVSSLEIVRAERVEIRRCAEGRIDACTNRDWYVSKVPAEADRRAMCLAGDYGECPTALLRSACKQGEVDACRELETPDAKQEVDRYCAAGFGQCSKGADLTLLETSCKHGSRRSCMEYVSREDRSALPVTERLDRACRYGNLYACARRIADRAERELSAESIRALEAACPAVRSAREDTIWPFACYEAGAAHAQGIGVAKNPGRALELFRRGCWEGSWFASDTVCLAFAGMLAAGVDVAPEPWRAASAYASACHMGTASTCCLRFGEYLDSVGEREPAREAFELARHGRAPGSVFNDVREDCTGLEGAACWVEGRYPGSCRKYSCRVGDTPAFARFR